MPTINLAEKYEQKVAERFNRGALTDGGAGKDYNFTGVKTIKIYSVDTVGLVDYTRSGTSRFGTLTELTDTVQELQLEVDKSFTYSIDEGNKGEQFNIKQASDTLKREIDEVVVPAVDTYRLKAWAQGRGLSSGNSVTMRQAAAALTKANILDEIFEAHAQMLDDNVSGEVTMYIPELTYVKAKLADAVVGGNALNGEAVRKGYKGTFDGMKVVTVPSNRWPTTADGKKVNFILKAAGTTVDPFKLKNYRIHKNPMGVDGDVVEGRIIFDSFVLDAKCKGILVDHAST